MRRLFRGDSRRLVPLLVAAMLMVFLLPTIAAAAQGDVPGD